MEKYSRENIQATTIDINTSRGNMKISAAYCPPRHNNKKQAFIEYFSTLGNRFIIGGDFNSKHTNWGSRLINTKGRELHSALEDRKINFMSSGEPTYWPTDQNKIPDLLDFFLFKGIDKKRCTIESCCDLFSDHSPVILTIHESAQILQKPPYLYNKKTDWMAFRMYLHDTTDLKIPLKTEEDLEKAVYYLTHNIQNAAWAATPEIGKNSNSKVTCSSITKELLKTKRNLRKNWQITRNRSIKLKLNQITKQLKHQILTEKNDSVQKYLSELTPFQTTDYDLWKATRKLKQPQVSDHPIRQQNGNWARTSKEKAEAFALHLSEVFKPWDIESTKTDTEEIKNCLMGPHQLELPIKKFTIKEMKYVISYQTNPNKSPGFDLITGRILQELPFKCLKLLMYIYNAIIRLKHFPSAWKISQIIMIHKPGKDADKPDSYRPISLLPILSKFFEKLLLNRLNPIIEEKNIIPNYQFGFRGQHSTIEQVHRLVNIINKSFERKEYCSGVFLDISQAFDKVWHEGLAYKLKKVLPYHYYEIIKSYLNGRQFFVKQNEEFSQIYDIEAGVPQGSVLGPLLFLIYTSDLPECPNTTVATFADDTAFLSSHANHIHASKITQTNLCNLQSWLVKWKIKSNETKSVHITFTLRRDTCPPVKLNNIIIPQANDVKYLGIHLDRRLTWLKHIFTKRKQLGLKIRNMYWLIGTKSQLSLENKLLIYKAILKPIWTYGIQLWGSASKSNIEIIQRFQNKILRIITDAPWYVNNEIIHNDLQIETVPDVIRNFSQKYRERLETHPNPNVETLMIRHNSRRLQRKTPADL